MQAQLSVSLAATRTGASCDPADGAERAGSHHFTNIDGRQSPSLPDNALTAPERSLRFPGASGVSASTLPFQKLDVIAPITAQNRCTSKEVVKVAREVPGFHQTLAATGRAIIPIPIRERPRKEPSRWAPTRRKSRSRASSITICKSASNCPFRAVHVTAVVAKSITAVTNPWRRAMDGKGQPVVQWTKFAFKRRSQRF